MTTVFISYRREDSADAAGRLRDRLAREFGAERVFFDVSNIASGERFARVIADKLASCDAVLVVIGKSWLVCSDAQGQRRIDAPDDWVRREIAAALDRERIETIPILIDEARMPRAADLPPDIARLAEHNAHQLRHTRYDDDIGLLIERLRAPGDRATSLWARLREVLLGRAAAASALAIAFLMLLFAWMRVFDFFALDTRIESYTMWLGEQFAPVTLSPHIAIVAITENTERALDKRFDRSWRGEHARLLRNLAGAKAVAFDLEFREISDFDAEFIAAVESAKRSGTAVFFGARSQANWETSAVDGAASAVGHLCIGKRVGYASLAPLAVERDNRILSALALHAVYRPLEVGLDYSHSLIKVRGRDALQLLEFSLLEQVRLPHAGCVAIQKGDAVAALMIRLSPLEGLRAPGLRYRYEDVIAQQSSALQDFAGKIVLVGLQKKGEDKFLVRGGEERFGIELHADVVNNLISGINVRPLGGGGEFALTAAMAAFGATLRVWRPHPALRWRLVLIAAVIAMYLALVVYVCQEFHVLLNTVYHVGAFVLAYWTVGRLARRWAA